MLTGNVILFEHGRQTGLFFALYVVLFTFRVKGNFDKVHARKITHFMACVASWFPTSSEMCVCDELVYGGLTPPPLYCKLHLKMLRVEFLKMLTSCRSVCEFS